MERDKNISSIFKRTVKESPPVPSFNKIIPKSEWITNEQVMKSLSIVSGGIISLYSYSFEGKYYKDFRVFYDDKDMINTIVFEIYSLFKNTSINISDDINRVTLLNDTIIIPKSQDNTDIEIQIMNSFITKEIFKSVKNLLTKMNTENEQKYIRVNK